MPTELSARKQEQCGGLEQGGNRNQASMSSVSCVRGILGDNKFRQLFKKFDCDGEDRQKMKNRGGHETRVFFKKGET